MPMYVYECRSCEERFELWQSIHDDSFVVHSEAEDDDCTGHIVRVIQQVNTYAVGPKGQETADTDARERQLVKDREAYKRFRDDGLQPQQLRGADELEARAKNAWFVETKGLVDVPDDKVQEVEERLGEARMSGWSPVEQVRAAKTKKGQAVDA